MLIKEREDPHAEFCALLDRLPDDTARAVARRAVTWANGIEHGWEACAPDQDGGSGGFVVEYVNTGDMYGETILRTGRAWQSGTSWDSWQVSCLGEAIEEHERQRESEGESKCAYCGEWIDHPTAGHGAESREDCTALHGSEFLEYCDAAGRTLFACAWGDWAETQDNISLSGVEIFDVIPDTPTPYRITGLALVQAVQTENGLGIAELHAQTVEATDARYSDQYADLHDFAHNLAMQCMGHGVGLWEHCDKWSAHKGGPFKTPLIEAEPFEGPHLQQARDS